MLPNHAQFIEAIQARNKVRVEFYSLKDSATIDRVCAPLDYGPSKEGAGAQNLYWLWDYNDNTGANPLGLAPEQIVRLSVLGEVFDPAGLLRAPRPWFVPRNWTAVTPVASIDAPTAS